MSGDAAPDRSDLRASHNDREQVVEVLRVAAGDGRLTHEELDERLERAMTARTYGELDALVRDLPANAGAGLARPQPAKELVQLRSHSGHIRREGAWTVPRRMEVEARSGHVLLDFTQAVAAHSTLDIELSVRSGHVRLIVPPGVSVDVDSVEMRSGHVKQRAGIEPGRPARLAITLSGQVRSGHVVIRGPRRGFWDWLRRRPAPSAPALPR